MQDAAQDVAPLDWTIARRTLQPNRTSLFDALMRPSMIVIVDIRGQHTMEMAFAQDQELVQTLLSNRTNPAFGERIRIGSPHWRPDDRNILRCEDRLEARRELGVTIVDQEAHGEHAILNLPTELPRLLSHPRTGRVSRAAGQMDAATSQLNEKQDVQSLQPRSFDGEEVAGNHLVLVVCQKRAPTAPLLLSFRRRRNAPSFQHIADRRAPDVVSEFAELALQLAVAPTWIFLRQAENQRFKLKTRGWSAQSGLLLDGPFPPYKLAVPLQQRVGLEEENNLTEAAASAEGQSRQFAGKNNQGVFLPSRNPLSVRLFALENPELLPQENDFDILVMLTSTTHPDEVEQE